MWILSRIAVERPREYASSKAASLKLVLPAKISNCAVYSSADMLNDIFRSSSLVCAVLEQSGSPKAFSYECFKCRDRRCAINDCLCLIVCPYLSSASHHKGKSIEHLCPLIWEGGGLDSNGKFDSMDAPISFSTITTEFLWIHSLDGAGRGG